MAKGSRGGKRSAKEKLVKGFGIKRTMPKAEAKRKIDSLTDEINEKGNQYRSISEEIWKMEEKGRGASFDKLEKAKKLSREIRQLQDQRLELNKKYGIYGRQEQ